MGKIGILTYHRAINYGALLQVYALQHIIQKLSAECIIIDYRNNKLENRHKKMSLSNCKCLKDYIRFFLIGKAHNKKFDKFREFSKKHLRISKPCYNKDNLETISSEFDKIICGSDQVWNHNINDFDKAYYLDFINSSSKKYAFSASFGYKKIKDEYKSEYKNLLNDYNMISVREKHAANIIEELIGTRPEVVLDPTMLIKKDEWIKLANDYKYSSKYILIYAYSGTHIMNLAKNIAKKTGFKIVMIKNHYLPRLNIKYEKTVGPRDFLGIFKNAEYILTNSFHGTIFSINLNKEFFTELLPEPSNVNSRLEHVMELFGLKNRLITNNNPEIINIKINYENLNKKLDKERNKSINFLQQIINS